MKILKMIGWEEEEVPTTTILCIFLHLVNYSTFLKIILRHTCQFGRAIGRTFACLEDEKYALQNLLTSLNFGYVVCTYCRTKKDNKKIRIVSI